jgi:pyruvate kinase
MGIQIDIKLLMYRRTKIVATVGPSSRDSDTIERMIKAGVNVFRLNMSHDTHDNKGDDYQRIRTAAENVQKPVAVLADLCGPKIRVGAFHNGRIMLDKGDAVTVTTRDVVGGPGLIASQYQALADDVEIGNRILLDDGNIELIIRSIDDTEIACEVVAGGVLSDHKGMNLPGVAVSQPSLTQDDRIDAQFALQLGVDFLALSFVRRASDIEALRELVSAAGVAVSIVAKIETAEALDNIEEILDAADAIMVARGDLGVELPPQAVPTVQNQLVDLARTHHKPVIVATQMLESMIEHPRPTRAEVSDVATAVRTGADAVMLSAETAVGKYPVEAVKITDDIARQIEGYLWKQSAFGSLTGRHETVPPLLIEDALSKSMAHLSRDLLVRGIMVISLQGRSLAVMSSSRPGAPIVGICPDYRSSCIASLLWGVIPVTADPEAIGEPHSLARKTVMELHLASEGDTILVVRGFSSDPKQNTPSVTIVTV